MEHSNEELEVVKVDEEEVVAQESAEQVLEKVAVAAEAAAASDQVAKVREQIIRHFVCRMTLCPSLNEPLIALPCLASYCFLWPNHEDA